MKVRGRNRWLLNEFRESDRDGPNSTKGRSRDETAGAARGRVILFVAYAHLEMAVRRP